MAAWNSWIAEAKLAALTSGGNIVLGKADSLLIYGVPPQSSRPGSRRPGAAQAREAGAITHDTSGSLNAKPLADADVKAAATVACRARNQNNGQSCIAAKRFIVEEPVADEFEELFSKAVGALKVGDPMDRGNQVGPLARADLVDDLERQVAESVRLGARTLTGGGRAWFWFWSGLGA